MLKGSWMSPKQRNIIGWLLSLVALSACGEFQALPKKALQTKELRIQSSNFVASGAQAIAGYDIIVVAGQSNSVGRGFGDFTDDKSKDSSIFQLGRFGVHNLQIIPADDSLEQNDPSPNDGTGLAMSFAREYVKAHSGGRPVLIIPAGRSGSSILEWDPSNSALYSDMRARTLAALAMSNDSRVVAFLWHQGETDILKIESGNVEKANAEIYRAKFKNLVSQIKADFSVRGAFPVLAGEVLQSWKSGSQAKQQVTNVVASTIAENNGLFVPSTGLHSNLQDGVLSDEIHFSAKSAVLYGKLYYNAFSTGSASDPRIQNLYRVVLGREYDIEGGAFWTNELLRQSSLSHIRQALAQSDEAKNKIVSLFNSSVHRQPLVTELYKYVNDLALSKSMNDIAIEIATLGGSYSGQPTTQPAPLPTALPIPLTVPAAMPMAATVENVIDGLYITMFNRIADRSGFEYWAQYVLETPASARVKIASVATAAKLADGFAQNEAFDRIYGAVSEVSFIQTLYVNSGGSGPDAGELNYWLARLSELEKINSRQAARASVVGEFVVAILTWDANAARGGDINVYEAGVMRQQYFFARIRASVFCELD
jgi:hypothetical protein